MKNSHPSQLLHSLSHSNQFRNVLQIIDENIFEIYTEIIRYDWEKYNEIVREKKNANTDRIQC